MVRDLRQATGCGTRLWRQLRDPHPLAVHHQGPDNAVEMEGAAIPQGLAALNQAVEDLRARHQNQMNILWPEGPRPQQRRCAFRPHLVLPPPRIRQPLPIIGQRTNKTTRPPQHEPPGRKIRGFDTPKPQELAFLDEPVVHQIIGKHHNHPNIFHSRINTLVIFINPPFAPRGASRGADPAHRNPEPGTRTADRSLATRHLGKISVSVSTRRPGSSHENPLNNLDDPVAGPAVPQRGNP